MAIDLGDSTFRPLLAADMLEAWSCAGVHHGEPTTPVKASKFPNGFLRLGNIVPERQGFSRQVLLHPYELTCQFRYPTGETNIETEKAARISEILAVLTPEEDNQIYARNDDQWRYRIEGMEFDTNGLIENTTERYYEVTLRFTLEWETGL